jgi:hypothetical protein
MRNVRKVSHWKRLPKRSRLALVGCLLATAGTARPERSSSLGSGESAASGSVGAQAQPNLGLHGKSTCAPFSTWLRPGATPILAPLSALGAPSAGPCLH